MSYAEKVNVKVKTINEIFALIGVDIVHKVYVTNVDVNAKKMVEDH